VRWRRAEVAAYDIGDRRCVVVSRHPRGARV